MTKSRSSAPGDILINGMCISRKTIDKEMQYHPAANVAEARYEAQKALVIRELLLQRATELGLCKHPHSLRNPDEVIDMLLKREIEPICITEEACAAHYHKHKEKFFTSPLFEVSHILFLAPPADRQARKKAYADAMSVLGELCENPSSFELLAREHSACSSATAGGRLGQISRGQTLPAFERALLALKAGESSKEPVASEVGYHLIKVHHRAEGALLPFESIAAWINKDLQRRAWRRSFRDYVLMLTKHSDILGFCFTDTPFEPENKPLVSAKAPGN